MDRQKSLWDDEFFADMQAKLHARRPDPATSHQAAEDVVKSGRMSLGCKEILIHITGRWASSAELAVLDLKYMSRISDLRQRGHKVEARMFADGEWYYKLDETE